MILPSLSIWASRPYHRVTPPSCPRSRSPARAGATRDAREAAGRTGCRRASAQAIRYLALRRFGREATTPEVFEMGAAGFEQRPLACEAGTSSWSPRRRNPHCQAEFATMRAGDLRGTDYQGLRTIARDSGRKATFCLVLREATRAFAGSQAALSPTVAIARYRPCRFMLKLFFAGVRSLPPGPTARTSKLYLPRFRCL